MKGKIKRDVADESNGHGISMSLQYIMLMILSFFLLSAAVIYTRQLIHEDIHRNNSLDHGKKSIFRSRHVRGRTPDLQKGIQRGQTRINARVDISEDWINETLYDIRKKKEYYLNMLLNPERTIEIPRKTSSPGDTRKDKNSGDYHKFQQVISNTTKLYAVTYASHAGRDDRFCRAMESALRNDIDIIILGWGVPWKGLSQKLDAAYKFALSVKPEDIILFTDAFDILYTQSSHTILQNFLEFNTSLVFSAECGCWPHVADDLNICLSKYPKSPTPYRYLNSGTWVGYSKSASEMLKTVIDEAGKDFDNANDQKLIADLYIAGRFGIQLDFHNKIFQSMHMTLDPPLAHCDPSEDVVEVKDIMLDRLVWMNKRTSSKPGVFHFNGGGKRYHLSMESKEWYKNPRFNSKEMVHDLKNKLVSVPDENSDRKLPFKDLCPNYLDREYSE